MTVDRGVTAPAYKRLRPMRREIVTPTFPVYPHLVETLTKTSAHPDDVAAHVLATCAGYSYSDADTVAMIMARLGLEGNRCRMIAQTVDAMLICSTAFVIQSHDGRLVIVCYRGTEPGSFINWLTDADVDPEKVKIHLPGHGPDGAAFDVHAGFYRNVRATRYLVADALDAARRGKSVLADGGDVAHPMEALYLTGHSLGAAMASLMAVMLVTEPAYRPLAEKLRAVYTYGQPMIGSPAFARACSAIELDGQSIMADRLVRYVYDRDVVPHLPPRESGDFAHFGEERQFRDGKWQRNRQAAGQTNLPGMGIAPLTLLTRQIRIFRSLPLPHSLDDHLPQHYIAALTPIGVTSEFGD